MTFQKMLTMGKTGEGIIAQWMKRQGYNVLPVYEKEQGDYKGPALYTVDGSLVAPDMVIFKQNGKAAWIEAKTKSAFTKHRITGRWVTGIDLRHYEQYIQVQQVSPWPVWLLFLHFPGQAKDSPAGCPYGLFGQSITYLQQHENHRHPNGGHGGMVYWAHDTLKKIAELHEVLGTHLTPGAFRGIVESDRVQPGQ